MRRVLLGAAGGVLLVAYGAAMRSSGWAQGYAEGSLSAASTYLRTMVGR